jgi:hypothetical protein
MDRKHQKSKTCKSCKPLTTTTTTTPNTYAIEKSATVSFTSTEKDVDYMTALLGFILVFLLLKLAHSKGKKPNDNLLGSFITRLPYEPQQQQIQYCTPFNSTT